MSLFAGAGGLDLGFERAGFKTIWMNELNKDACETYALWNKTAQIVQGDIRKVKESDIPKADIMLGAFPCQSFSRGGVLKGVDDSRGQMYKEYIRVIKSVRPKVFVGENVANLVTMQHGGVFRQIIQEFSEIGYNLQYKVINAKDYGVPQDRKRVMLIGVRDDIMDFPIIEPKKVDKLVTLRDTLYGLDEPVKEDIDQSGYSPRFMGRNRKRDWDDVSYTIVAGGRNCPLHPSSPSMLRIDKDHWEFGFGITRKFSWHEAALIQTFPKDMQFVGNLESKYKQIGNAVPPLLGELWGKEIMNYFNKNK